MKKTAIAVSLALALGAGAASAANMSSATFTMYDGLGGLVPTGTGGPDDTVTGSIGGGAWAVASATTFFGANWTAHDGTTFGPGTYDIDTVQGGVYTGIVVGAGQVGGHILFDWGATADIDVVNVWDVTTTGLVTTYTSTDVTAAGPAFYPDGTTPFVAPSGILGLGMIDGAFPEFNANFDFTVPVPVPAAVWLFGSGLVGLVGVARRRRKAA